VLILSKAAVVPRCPRGRLSHAPSHRRYSAAIWSSVIRAPSGGAGNIGPRPTLIARLGRQFSARTLTWGVVTRSRWLSQQKDAARGRMTACPSRTSTITSQA